MGRLDALGDSVRQLVKPNGLSLPAIPEGYVRLTHVMPERSRQILSSGEPFIYRKHGLTGTTDSYSDNAHIEHLARTGDPMAPRSDGLPSGWSRNEFGDHMALMDLPADAHKRIALSYGLYDDPIPNYAILGFVDRKSMEFAPNPRYDRVAIDAYGQETLGKIRRLIDERNARLSRRFGHRVFDEPAPAPDFTQRGGDDVW